VPSGAAITSDGRIYATSSWGDGATSPTIAVFDVTQTSGPIYTLVTPGSMNDIDMTVSGSNVIVASGGKHVHNNKFGDGGDIYGISIAI
jgi:hypothetical protein